MKRSFIAGVVMMIVLYSSALAQATGAHAKMLIGTWKQNVQKSTYNPGGPPPAGLSAIRQYAAGQDGSIVAITMNLDPNGLPSLGGVAAANYDGKEYEQHTLATLASSLGSHVRPPITRTIAYKQIDQYSVEIVQRENGSLVSKCIRTISRDGKTMTERYDYTNADGQRILNVLVFEKQ